MYIYIYIHRLLTEGREFEGKKHPKEFILGELAACHQVIYYFMYIYVLFLYILFLILGELANVPNVPNVLETVSRS